MPEELKDEVPEPLYTMLAEKEIGEEAIAKYRQRKEKVTTNLSSNLFRYEFKT